MRKKLKIIYVDYGIANRYDSYIEIHSKLLQLEYAILLKEIIEHEKAHTSKKYSMKDLALDLKGFENKRLYTKFVLSTPSSWVQFSPIYKSRSKCYWDWSVFLLWIFAIAITGILWRVTRYLLS
jgi:hypothetical protein